MELTGCHLRFLGAQQKYEMQGSLNCKLLLLPCLEPDPLASFSPGGPAEWSPFDNRCTVFTDFKYFRFHTPPFFPTHFTSPFAHKLAIMPAASVDSDAEFWLFGYG
jgi:hypothetical protein